MSNIRPNFLGDRAKTSTVGEIAVDLTVPRSIIALADEGGELRELIRGECSYGSLYFGETHSGTVSRTRRGRNRFTFRDEPFCFD